jgi:hypothetical protein
LVKELFEIYNTDTADRKHLSEIITDARELAERRHMYLHSMWYIPEGDPNAVARMKDGKSQQFTPEQMIEIADRMHKCFSELRELMRRSLPIDGREQ